MAMRRSRRSRSRHSDPYDEPRKKEPALDRHILPNVYPGCPVEIKPVSPEDEDGWRLQVSGLRVFSLDFLC